MVGLPFANVGSVELQERMKYVESLPGAGKDASREMYEVSPLLIVMIIDVTAKRLTIRTYACGP